MVLALREGRVEQAQRADDALDLPGDAAALQAHALAHAERPCAEQDGAGDEVAERLLRRETDDDRGEGAADGQGARVQSGHPQRDDDGEPDEDQADEEADRARGARVEAPEEGRPEGPADVARDLPAQDDEDDRRRDLHRRLVRPAEQLVAIAVADQDPDEQRDHDDGLDARALDRAHAQLPGEAGLTPGMALGVEQSFHASVVGGS